MTLKVDMDIIVYKAQTASLIKKKSLQQLLNKLPPNLQAKALRYRSESSRYNYIAGRLLLQHGLRHFKINDDLEQITFLKNGKPVLPGIHFSISHSDHQVICAFSREGRLGVDLEKINPIDFENFTSFFTKREWATIQGADDPIQVFYWYWTRKESIIKALGLTLNYLHQIELDISQDHFIINGKQLFLEDFFVKKGFMSAVCCEDDIGNIEVVEISF